MVGIGPALEDPVLDQPAQAVGQHRLGHVEVGLEVAEAPDAVQRVAHDQQRPPLPDHLERTGDPAVLADVVLAEHDAILAQRGSIIELTVLGCASQWFNH